MFAKCKNEKNDNDRVKMDTAPSAGVILQNKRWQRYSEFVNFGLKLLEAVYSVVCLFFVYVLESHLRKLLIESTGTCSDRDFT